MLDVDSSHSFGSWLKQARKSLDMTQGELAVRAGCSVKTIAKLESGERRPSKQLAELLASALGIQGPDLSVFMLRARGLAPDKAALATGKEEITSGVTPSDAAGDPRFSRTPNNLPAPLTGFVGREGMVGMLAATLRRPYTRLVTLTGVGGVGKTRLSIEVAQELLEDFPDGIYFVDLASLSSPELFFPTIIHTLGVEDKRARSPLALLSAHLERKSVLLVLDNFEQILGAAPLAAELLTANRGLKALITSREALRIRGEREVQVPPLSLPPGADCVYTEDLTRYEAVRLFVERARERRFDFALTEENAATVAGICRQLDGLPLAIELAAARARELTPSSMLEHLDNRLQTLLGPLVDLPERQRTLRATIAWSYDLLDEPFRQLFRCLAAFSGSFTPEAVSSVLYDEPDSPDGMLARLEKLADKSLLVYSRGRTEDEPRFAMLDTIREFALEQLTESGEAEAYHRRHASYFLALAEKAEPQLRGSQQKYWFDRLEDEHDNFRAALRWSLGQENAETSLLLCGWLTLFWYYRGYTVEGRQWLAAALDRAGSVSTELRAKLFNAAGILAWAQGDYEEALCSYESSLAVWRTLGDSRRVSYALYNIAGVMLVTTRFTDARPILEELVPMYREAGNKTMLSSTLNRLSIILEYQGDLDTSEALCHECLALDSEAGDAMHIARMKSRLGGIALRRARHGEADCLFRESLTAYLELEDKDSIAKILGNFGLLAGARGCPVKMAHLLGAEAALRELLNSPMSPLEDATYEPYLAAAREQISDSGWKRAYSEGRAMSMEQAVAYALEEDGS